MSRIPKIVAACGLIFSSQVSLAQDAPNIVNPQTGAMVEFTRAYWDANADIADRVIQCDFFEFNDVSAVFEKKPEANTEYPPEGLVYQTRSYFHRALPDIPPHINIALFGDDTTDVSTIRNYRFTWGVTDGVYAGIAPFAESEFVEIVSYQSSTNNAVSVWHESAETPSYHVCYALDGQALLPTGSANSPTNYVSLPDFTFETPAEIDLNEGT